MAYDRPVQIVAASGIPVGLPGSGSIGVNGALTLTTALPLTYSNIWLFFPAGAVYTNSPAGCYFCQMSSTTLGTIYNNVLSGVPYIPSVLNPVTSASVGSYTSPTTTQSLFSFTVPGGIMGANGQMYIETEYTYPSNANSKIGRVDYGGVSLIAGAVTTSVVQTAQKWLTNRGSTGKQFSRPASSPTVGVSAVATTQPTIDTESNQTMTFSATLANAADYVTFENFNVLTYFAG
jgi:hypothetical protein